MDIKENIANEAENSALHVEEVLLKTFRFLVAHDGAGKMEVNIKLLKRGQKEVLIQCGRTYRFVINNEKNEAIQPEQE